MGENFSWGTWEIILFLATWCWKTFIYLTNIKSPKKKNLRLSIYTWYIFTQPVCIGYSHLLGIILSSEYTSGNENVIALTFPDLTVVDANSSLNNHAKKSPQVGYCGMHLASVRIKGNMKYFHKVLRQGGFLWGLRTNLAIKHPCVIPWSCTILSHTLRSYLLNAITSRELWRAKKKYFEDL